MISAPTRYCPWAEQPDEWLYCPQCGASRRVPLADRAGRPVLRECPLWRELHPPPPPTHHETVAAAFYEPARGGCCPGSLPPLPPAGGVWLALASG